eukprot:UN31107
MRRRESSDLDGVVASPGSRRNRGRSSYTNEEIVQLDGIQTVQLDGVQTSPDYGLSNNQWNQQQFNAQPQQQRGQQQGGGLRPPQRHGRTTSAPVEQILNEIFDVPSTSRRQVHGRQQSIGHGRQVSAMDEQIQDFFRAGDNSSPQQPQESDQQRSMSRRQRIESARTRAANAKHRQIQSAFAGAPLADFGDQFGSGHAPTA